MKTLWILIVLSWIFAISEFILTLVKRSRVSRRTILLLVIIIIPVFLAVLYRMKVEEKLFINEFGDKYLEYAEKTKRLIP